MNIIAQLRDPSHEQYRTPNHWQDLIKRNGFEITEIFRFPLPLDYEDWIERQAPPMNSREKIIESFTELTDDQSNRIRLTMTNNRPKTFEYPVVMFCCGPAE